MTKQEFLSELDRLRIAVEHLPENMSICSGSIDDMENGCLRSLRLFKDIGVVAIEAGATHLEVRDFESICGFVFEAQGIKVYQYWSTEIGKQKEKRELEHLMQRHAQRTASTAAQDKPET